MQLTIDRSARRDACQSKNSQLTIYLEIGVMSY